MKYKICIRKSNSSSIWKTLSTCGQQIHLHIYFFKTPSNSLCIFFSTFIKIIIFTLFFLLLCFSHLTSSTPPSSPTQNHNPCSATTSGPCRRSNSLSLSIFSWSLFPSLLGPRPLSGRDQSTPRSTQTHTGRPRSTQPRSTQTHAQAEIVEQT